MTADDVRGGDYEAAKPTATRTLVTGDPWVRDHLPECPQASTTPIRDLLHDVCICRALRAAEQRVEAVAVDTIAQAAAEAEQRHLTLTQQYGDYRYREGRAAGVQAAREAVAALPHDTYCATREENYQRPCNCPVDDALAAIDALRNDSSDDGTIVQVSPQPLLSEPAVQGYDGQWHRDLYGGD